MQGATPCIKVQVLLVYLLEISVTQITSLPCITLITNESFDVSPWRGHLNINLVNVSKANLSLADALMIAEKALGTTEGKKKVKVLIGSGNDFVDKLIEHVAEHFAVPLISISKESYKNKKHYQVRMLPSPNDRDHVILHLALELGCNHITVFTCHHKLPTFSAEFYSKLKNHESIGLRFVRLRFSETPLAMVKMTDEIYQMSNYSSALMVLDCTDEEVSLLIKAADLVSVRRVQFWWLVLRDDTETAGNINAGHLPTGLLAIRSKFKEERYIVDALTLLNLSLPQLTLSELAATNHTSSYEDQQRKLYSTILRLKFWGETGWVQFDEQGDRIKASYDLVRTSSSKNSSQGNIWTTVGSAHGFKINLYNTFWIGAEMANYLPKIFRVVVIVEEPMLVVSKQGVASDLECVLSYPCTKYVAPLGSNSSSTSTPFIPVRCCCIGFLIDVLTWVVKDLSLRVQIYIVKDGNFGAYNRTTKKWNGMIADLLDHQADMALSTLTTTLVRAEYVDFSYPFLYGQTKIVISNKSLQSSSIWEFGFLAPFDVLLWVTFLGSVTIIVWIVWALERGSPYGHASVKYVRGKFGITACMSFIWSNVVKLEIEGVKPRSFGARLTTAVFSFFTLIIITSYTAKLAASLFLTKYQFPVTGINDPKDPPDGFTFSTLRSSGTLSIFTDSKNPAYRRIGKHMLPYVVESYSEGIEKLKTGELDAFIYDSPFIVLGVSKMPGCSFRVVGAPIAVKPYAVAFPKKSTWRDPISYLMLRYEKKDFFRKLTEKWFRGGCLYSKEPTQGATRMSPANFSGFFLIHIGAVVMCFFILLVEYLWFCRVKKTGSYLIKETTRTVARGRSKMSPSIHKTGIKNDCIIMV